MTARAGRFTAYLPDEREALHELARAEAGSENFLVRTAVRALLGLPIPEHYRQMIAGNVEPGGASCQPAERRAAA